MVVRRRRKIRKYRGTRTCGYGITGQNRGKGLKGGYGKSGRHKHLWTWVMKYQPDYFGKKGFKPPLSLREKVKPINLGQLDQIVRKLTKSGELKIIDGKITVNVLRLGYNKVLGGGKLTKPIIIESPSFSKKAEEKIAQIGGKAIKL